MELHVLSGLSPAQLGTLRPTFWLINLGNALRVTFQILTDTYPWACPIMAVSARRFWAIDLWLGWSAGPIHQSRFRDCSPNRRSAGTLAGLKLLAPRRRDRAVLMRGATNGQITGSRGGTPSPQRSVTR